MVGQSQWDGIDRRKGPDWLVKTLRFMSLTGWSAFIVVLVLLHYAMPERETGLVRYHGITIRDYWDPFFYYWALYPLWICCGISLVTVLISRKRLRRLGDSARFNKALLAFLSVGTMLILTLIVEVD